MTDSHKTAPDSARAVGVDLGGTKIRAAIIEAGKVIGEPIQVPTPENPSEIMDALVGLIGQFGERSYSAIGIATAGVVDCNTGEVVGSTGNLPGWAGTKIKEVIEAKTGLPTHVENDANAAAYGEAQVDDVHDFGCVVCVTLGTGIGGGIVIGDELFYGSRWGAGEIGHFRIALENKRLCTCGLYDCWEAYGSGRGLEQTGREILDGTSPDKSKLSLLGDNLDTYAIVEAFKEGDLVAQEILHKWHEHLAIGVVNLIHILNPDCFVITGGLSKICDLSLLKEMVIDRTMHGMGESVEIRPSILGDHAGIIGAAQCVLDKLVLKDKVVL